MTLGERICQLRSQRRWSQGELADALGVSRQSVSKWETDAAVPELDKLVRLSRLFDISLDALVTGEGPAGPEAAGPSPESGEAPGAAGAEASSSPSRRGSRAALALLCCALVILALGTLLAGPGAGLLFSVLPFVLAAVCALCPRHPALFSLWALFLLVDGFLRFAMGCNWRLALRSAGYAMVDNPVHIWLAWIQLLGMLALLGAGVWVFRKAPARLTSRRKAGWILGWVLWAVSCLPLTARLTARLFAALDSALLYRLLLTAWDDACLLLLAWLLSVSSRALLERRRARATGG